MTHGMVLGKFLPPHQGHMYLVEFARRWVEDLTVVVGTLAAEPIPGALRYAWMRELFPDARVVHLEDENPQDPSEHPDFWTIWRTSLQRVLPPRPLTHVFASEPYGERLAAELGATFIPVDLGRVARPVSGTAIRRDPWAHWSFLPLVVRPHFLKRICIFGPESTGKSTLAAALARHYGTIAVPEYARTLIEWRKGELAESDLECIARGQIASEEALARQATHLLVCDTDVLTTRIWSEIMFDRCAPWIAAQARARSYDLTLLLDVDVPWIDDIVRYLPDDRRSFFDRCERMLRDAGRPYVVIRGDWDARWASAVAAVDRLCAQTGWTR